MKIFDIFSRRQEMANTPTPDAYRYDELPQRLRVQIIHILRDVLGDATRSDRAGKYYKAINDMLSREYGMLNLPLAAEGGYQAAVLAFVHGEEPVERVLDVVEMAFRIAEDVQADLAHEYSGASITADDAIAEFNARCQQHAVGYRYEAGKIIRIDSEYIHREVVKPSINLLQGGAYQGAEEEFLLAHEHYRNGRHKEALNESLKAIESTLKTICARRGWSYPENATAGTLIDLVFRQQLIPGFLQSEFSALRATLEAGVPPTRNRMSGHGQGAAPLPVPPHIAAYALHITAAAIVLLVEAEKAK